MFNDSNIHRIDHKEKAFQAFSFSYRHLVGFRNTFRLPDLLEHTRKRIGYLTDVTGRFPNKLSVLALVFGVFKQRLLKMERREN